MIIVADKHIPYVKDYFSPVGDLILKPGRSMNAADVQAADMLLVRSITHVNQGLLAGSKVKFVGSVTAGADHLDTAWLDDKGIAWSVAAGFNAPPVADYVLSVIAALYRQTLLARTPRVAIIGCGNVGSLVAKRLTALGFEVLCCDPLRAAQDPDFVSTPLNAIADVDLITLHVPLTKTGPHATHHFIDKTFLSRQKPDCVLLNTSRGAVIDTHALLEHGQHLHWCFDVWEHEPHMDKRVLERAVIATPHIAGYSVQSKMRGTAMLYQMACAKHILNPPDAAPITMPKQALDFSSVHCHWQEIALSIFNPLIITAMMRAILITPDENSTLFDDMRHQFNYRHEFAFTTITGAILAAEDERILKQWGLQF